MLKPKYKPSGDRFLHLAWGVGDSPISYATALIQDLSF